MSFLATLSSASPPDGLSIALTALWLDGRGDWDAAHRQLQDGESHDVAWVHAYLHRKEGDLSNAAYWYRRAGELAATGPRATEWADIVRRLLPTTPTR